VIDALRGRDPDGATYAYNLLPCMSPVLAQSEHNEMSAWLSAFGAKQTSDETVASFGPTRLTQSGHAAPSFVAMHATDLLQTCYSQSVILAWGEPP
jgi:hypothetical protein